MTMCNKDLACQLIGNNTNIFKVRLIIQADALSFPKKKLGIIQNLNRAVKPVKVFEYVLLAIRQLDVYMQVKALQSLLDKYLDAL